MKTPDAANECICPALREVPHRLCPTHGTSAANRPDAAIHRRAWFKLLACPSHTWPISSCDRCWQRVIAQLERDAKEAGRV